MKVVTAPVLLALISTQHAVAQPPGTGPPHCSEVQARYITPAQPSPAKCEKFQHGQTYQPEQFTYKSAVAHFVCPTSGVRIIVGNGLPDHQITMGNLNPPCWTNWWVQVPLNPERTGTIIEPASLEIVAMTLSGVPFFGANELTGMNAVEPDPSGMIQDGQYSWGHATQQGTHHYHSPEGGYGPMPSETTLIGYALDGFPVYGALADDSSLDLCNGRVVNGKYQYHVRSKDQVNENADYCHGTDSFVQWNYVVGCFAGDTSTTVVTNYETQTLPEDCVLQRELSNNIEELGFGDLAGDDGGDAGGDAGGSDGNGEDDQAGNDETGNDGEDDDAADDSAGTSSDASTGTEQNSNTVVYAIAGAGALAVASALAVVAVLKFRKPRSDSGNQSGKGGQVIIPEV